MHLKTVWNQIETACKLANRSSKDIHLLAVTKGKTPAQIRDLVALGQNAIGESYLQELIEKQKYLSDLPISWHFIGHVQSNKATAIATRCDWIHSVDSLKLAERLNHARSHCPTPLNICIQINVAAETQKYGVLIKDVNVLIDVVQQLPHLNLRGFMIIPQTGDEAHTRSQYHRLKQLYEAIKASGVPLDTLSMGMSQDFAIAIEEGATMVRIGHALFA